jgi:hypothetical protein
VTDCVNKYITEVARLKYTRAVIVKQQLLMLVRRGHNRVCTAGVALSASCLERCFYSDGNIAVWLSARPIFNFSHFQ